MSPTAHARIDPERAALPAGEDARLDILIRLQAGDPPPTTDGPPLNLALVIDRSGSMSGQPLAEAVRVTRQIIDQLRPTDRVALVTYDDTVRVDCPSQLLGDRSAFHAALAEIRSGGATALHDGWLAGAEQVAKHQSAEAINRVLLLSDGQANEGLTDPEAIAEQGAELARTQVTTTTVGLGHAFNEDLMIALANAGQGNHYYGETAEDLSDPFRTELDLLRALCARGLELRAETAPGVSLELLNGYTAVGDRCWRLPDLAWGAEAWVLFAIQVPAKLPFGDGPLSVFRAYFRYTTTDEQTEEADAGWLSLPVRPAAELAEVPVDETVTRRRRELEAARLHEVAAAAAEREDWDQISDLCAEARPALAPDPWLAASLDSLEDVASTQDSSAFRKQARYKSEHLRRRLAPQNEGDNYSEQAEMQSPAYLRRKTREGRRFPDAEDE
jgi:Ca-activated chloride channel family protein